MTGSLRVPRRAALAAIAVLVAAASLVSFAESYRGLFIWAAHHGLGGAWAVSWPLQVDVFIAVGELALFVALADRWPPRSRAAAWAVTLAGLAASVAGNVGHIAAHSLASRATAAVPPLAAAAALAVGLGVLKRVVAMHGSTSVQAPAPEGAPEPDTGALAQVGGLPADLRILAWLARSERLPSAASAAPVPVAAPEPDAAHPLALSNGYGAPERGQEAARIFADELSRGELPSVRRVRRELRVGQPRAQEVRAYLTTLTRT
jgi:Protein of unknown function (DUF2637)